jgi:magnesium transporter
MSSKVRVYKQGVVTHEDFPLADISEHLQDKSAVIWLDILQPEEADFNIISEEFDLHGLAIEDAIHEHQRPKLDRYEKHLFLSAYDIAINPRTNTLHASEIGVFITDQAIITVRKSDTFNMDDVVKRWDSNPDLAKNGVSYFLWGLLDYIVDRHFAAVQSLDDKIDELEEILFSERKRSENNLQRSSYELRKDLVAIRRVVLPMREAVNSLFRRDLDVVNSAMQPYYQDVYDHVLRVSELTESLRDLLSTIFETQLSLQDTRLNEIMKKLTAYAAIIAVPTAVTGFFGQNVPYPGFAHRSGLIASSLIIISIASFLYIAFRKNDWL